MNLTDKITITNEDYMELLKRKPNNYYSLSIVDPPYGINMDGGKYGIDGAAKAENYCKKQWN